MVFVLMSKIIDAINSLEDLLPLKAATSTQITDAELQLRVSFSEEYKEYLRVFGAIMADGIELSGITKAEHRSVVALTKKERKLNPKVPNTMYVVENPHIDGIIVWQDTSGNIYKTLPQNSPKKIAKSLAEYIEKIKR